MATTTPNYGWDVPTSTDYVINGAVAIETLGDDIDATLFSVSTGKNVGMSMLATTTFASQSTISFSSLFTSSWDSYKIVVNITSASTAGTLLLRLRSGTTDNSSATYNRQELTANSTTVTAGQGASQTAFLAGAFNTAGAASEITLFNPLPVAYTYITSQGVSPTSSVTMVNSTGFFAATTAFNGFSVVTSTGTISGNIKVYGYRSAV